MSKRPFAELCDEGWGSEDQVNRRVKGTTSSFLGDSLTLVGMLPEVRNQVYDCLIWPDWNALARTCKGFWHELQPRLDAFPEAWKEFVPSECVHMCSSQCMWSLYNTALLWGLGRRCQQQTDSYHMIRCAGGPGYCHLHFQSDAGWKNELVLSVAMATTPTVPIYWPFTLLCDFRRHVNRLASGHVNRSVA